MAGMTAEPKKKTTTNVEGNRADATREDAAPESDGTLEEAVRRSMHDLEQEKREVEDRSCSLASFAT